MTTTWTNLEITFPAGASLDDAMDLSDEAIAVGDEANGFVVIIPVPEDSTPEAFRDLMDVVVAASALPTPSGMDLVDASDDFLDTNAE